MIKSLYAMEFYDCRKKYYKTLVPSKLVESKEIFI